jgi:hypothetical protein
VSTIETVKEKICGCGLQTTFLIFTEETKARAEK